jgi:HK97 family phage portal protein
MGPFARLVRSVVTMPYMSLSAAKRGDWLWEALGGSESSSGAAVTPRSTLGFPPMWRAINLLSADVGKLPIVVYEREEDGDGKEKATEHPAYKLLRYKPNAEMTAMVFRQTLQAHALLHGNGYAYIKRNGAGEPEELIPLLPGACTAVRVNGVLWYYITWTSDTNSGAMNLRWLDSSEVLHIRGLAANGLTGYPIYTIARDALGLGLAGESYAARYFASNSAPNVVFEHPGKPSPAAMKLLKDSWDNRPVGKAVVTQEGMKLTTFGSDAEKSQLLPLREFSIRMTANLTGVPPHKLGDTTRTAYASLEQENQAYLDDALDPWLVKWEEECRDKLLTEAEKESDSHVIEFNRKALVRANLVARGQFYNLGINGGWLSADDVRASENYNSIPDGKGKTYRVPLNSTEATAPGAEPADALPAEPAVDEIPVEKPTRAATPEQAAELLRFFAAAQPVSVEAVQRQVAKPRKPRKKAT